MSDADANAMKAVWKSQSVEVPIMTIPYVNHRNSELQRAFRVRNVLEQGACVLALIWCGAAVFMAPHVWTKVGVALLMAGVFFALMQWRRRAAPDQSGRVDSVESGLVFYRRELERKRDVHRTLWRWYLLPMAPGCIVLLAWSFFGDPNVKGTWTPWTGAAIAAAWIAIALIYERSKVAQYQREIDALPSMSETAGTRNPRSGRDV